MIKKPPPEFVRGGGLESLGHICQELAPFPQAGGCRGFKGPVPPPLWMCPAMSATDLSKPWGHRKAQVACVAERNPMPTTMTTDEPRSPHAEPAQATPQANGAD